MSKKCIYAKAFYRLIYLPSDEILKAAEKNPTAAAANRPAPVTLRDSGPAPGPSSNSRPIGPTGPLAPALPQQQLPQAAQRPIPAQSHPVSGPARQPPAGYQQPPRGYQTSPAQGVPPGAYGAPQSYPGGLQRGPAPQMRGVAPAPGQMPPYAARPQLPLQGQPPNMVQPQPGLNQPRRF